MSNFTKGEWKVYGDWGINTGDSTECHATFENYGDAHLIAAAPDMYAMIKELAHELNLAIDECNEYRAKSITPPTESEPDYIDKQTVHEAQVLLAKARGQS